MCVCAMYQPESEQQPASDFSISPSFSPTSVIMTRVRLNVSMYYVSTNLPLSTSGILRVSLLLLKSPLQALLTLCVYVLCINQSPTIYFRHPSYVLTSFKESPSSITKHYLATPLSSGIRPYVN